MKRNFLWISVFFLSLGLTMTGQENSIKLDFDQANQVINKNIYGQFAEHLGRCIYDGIWVGHDSDIPNENGYRKDVLEALKALEIPEIGRAHV